MRSVFPDSGYAADHAYGEIAHWEPFTAAYLDWIVENHPPPWETLEDRQRVAFLLGAMSHGMADQVYDSLFMHKIELDLTRRRRYLLLRLPSTPRHSQKRTGGRRRCSATGWMSLSASLMITT